MKRAGTRNILFFHLALLRLQTLCRKSVISGSQSNVFFKFDSKNHCFATQGYLHLCSLFAFRLDISPGRYFRNFWVVMWHWDPGTLSLYQNQFQLDILLPYTRVNFPNHSYSRVAIFQHLRSLAQSKVKPKQHLISQLLLS